MNKSDVIAGGFMMAAGIYIWSYHYFHPDKFSPRLTRKVCNWACFAIVVCGLVTTLARIVIKDK